MLGVESPVFTCLQFANILNEVIEALFQCNVVRRVLRDDWNAHSHRFQLVYECTNPDFCLIVNIRWNAL